MAQKYLDEMAVEAKKRARDCYLSLHTLPNRLQAALVMLDPEVELLLPMADPRRQALYAATSS
ncbi:MAG TPA: hypothetical protein PK765_02390 [bacterium]|nr:hypothetical protein [bacterium]